MRVAVWLPDSVSAGCGFRGGGNSDASEKVVSGSTTDALLGEGLEENELSLVEGTGWPRYSALDKRVAALAFNAQATDARTAADAILANGGIGRVRASEPPVGTLNWISKLGLYFFTARVSNRMEFCVNQKNRGDEKRAAPTVRWNILANGKSHRRTGFPAPNCPQIIED